MKMNLVLSLFVLVLVGCATAPAEPTRANDSYKQIIELKYATPVERFKLIDFAPTTKILWFDWQQQWSGAMNVIETTPAGTPLYWYDIPQPPSAQSIENIRVLHFAGEKFLEVIDCTHMGNGMLYLYEVRAGFVMLKLKVRVMTNIGGLHFEPRIAHIDYRELEPDRPASVVLTATWIDHQDSGNRDLPSGHYYREYQYKTGAFQEVLEKRRGLPELMD